MKAIKSAATPTRKRARATSPATRTRAAAPAPAARAAGAGVCVGVLVSWDERGPLVDFDGNAAGPVRARLTGGAQARPPQGSAAAGHEVVLLVDPRPGRAPVLLGLLQPLGGEPASPVEARVDGKRVELEGHDEIVLRCGAASITLRSNGRVVISGMQVETRARGLNRIKGGSVAIN